MIHAYDKVYLDKARTALGRMLDFAVYDLKYDIEDFFALFITSGIAARFEKGDYSVIVGMSGVELAYKVLELAKGEENRIKPKYSADRSEEYWAGWALAYYQWDTALSFEEIVRAVPMKRIVEMYSPYHEMDIRQFCDKMNERYCAAQPETNLKALRQRADLSQSDPEGSYLANVQIPLWIAQASAGRKLICFSSDQVYSGSTENGPYTEEMVAPGNVYAAHKLEMEQRVLDCLPDAVMLRVEWMYDIRSPKPNYLLNILQATDMVAFSSSQYRGVTYLREVAENMDKVAHSDIGNCRRVNDRIRAAFLNDSLDVFLRGIPKRWRRSGTLHRLHQSMAYEPIRAGY